MAAVSGSKILQCPITPKIHAMLRHVQWQMKNIPGGLGDKMEDWVERQHQWGMRQRRRFVQDPLVRALAREKATSRNTHPDVLAQVDATDTGNKRKCSEKKADVISTRQNCSEMWGGSRQSNISLTTKSRHYHGRRHYFAMGRWIQTARTLTVWNIHVIL